MKSSQPEKEQEDADADADADAGDKSLRSSSSPRKTRDLPNLSKCQACGFRIDACAGKTRIRFLYSEWRVVLLCKKCFVLVESSVICSYCLTEISGENCFRCCQCRRSVHDACFWQYKSVPSWRYSATDSPVCVDCWVPKPIASKRGSLRCKRVSKESSNVSKPVNERKLRMNSDESCQEADNGGAGSVSDDVELAFQLHRAMNCSPRISKNRIMPDSDFLSGLSGLRNGDVNHEVSLERECLKPKLRVYARTRWKYGKYERKLCVGSENLRERLMEGKENCTRRWKNVYTRNRWRNVRHVWNISVGSENIGARLLVEQERCSTSYLKVYTRTRLKKVECVQKLSCDSQNARTRLKKGECVQKLSCDSQNAEGRLKEGEGPMEVQGRFSARLVRVYVRTRLKNCKSLQNSRCCFQTAEVGLMEEEELTKNSTYPVVPTCVGSEGSGCTQTEGQENSSRLTKVYMRTRLKNGRCMQKLSCGNWNAEVRLEEAVDNCYSISSNLSRDDFGMQLVFGVCHNQDQSAVPRDERSNEKTDRCLIKYHRKVNSKSSTVNRSKYLYEGFLHKI